MPEFIDILIRRMEEDPKLTPAGLAKSAGLDDSTIRQMIKFRRSPRVDTAMKICRALGTTIEAFMGQPQTDAERRILRLVSELSEPLLQRLLGYGEGLVEPSGPALPKSVPEKR